MKKGGGRVKGSKFELVLAKQISKAIGLPYGSAVRRTPNSGALTTRADLYIAPKYFDRFPYFLEAKCRESWSFQKYFTSKTEWEVFGWYRDAIEKCKDDPHYPDTTIPILVFTQNRALPLVMLREDYYEKLSEKINLFSFGQPMMVVDNQAEHYYIMPWGNFLDLVTKDL
jgi:hypothetical protein